MDVKKRTFDETAYEIAVYGGAYARFLVNGAFCKVPENVEDTAREKGLRVAAERVPKGYTLLHAQRLVPWDTEKPELAELFEAQMEQFKKDWVPKLSTHKDNMNRVQSI